MILKLRDIITGLSRPSKRIIMLAFDFLALSFAVWAAYSLRLNTLLVPDNIQLLVIFLAPVAAIPVFIRLGLYRSVIRYLPGRALWTIIQAIGLATLIWVGGLFALEITRLGTVPRSLPVIYAILVLIIVGGSRFLAKYLLWAPIRQGFSGQVLIYGAGEAGAQLAAALRQEKSKFVAGFIDDDPSLHGGEVQGIKVHSPSRLPHLIDTLEINEIIISAPSMNAVQQRKIISELSGDQLKIRALPALADLASGRYLISQVREIEIGDILGRSSVPADPELFQKMIEGRSILVSGAGGSIGSELCRLIVKWSPRKLVLLEANEFALYQIERELRKNTDLPLVPILGSVTDPSLIKRTLNSETVQVVFHAAAHKHVPLVEANVLEGVRNNIFGTQTIVSASFDAGVESFVLISTDKAVRPTNVMGATKRWAELIVTDYANRAQSSNSGQKFCAVRFGNVLGSNGSVVPLFKEQIAQGGPVTVTDGEMTRYFMSIHEAAELIVQAGALSRGGDIFILEMGEPIRIRDLAENMIGLAGVSLKSAQNPDGDIEIITVGRRPGEKIHEELFYDPESAKPTRKPKILRAVQSQQLSLPLTNQMKLLTRAFDEHYEAAVRKALFELVAMSENQAVQNPVVTLEVVNKSSI